MSPETEIKGEIKEILVRIVDKLKEAHPNIGSRIVENGIRLSLSFPHLEAIMGDAYPSRTSDGNVTGNFADIQILSEGDYYEVFQRYDFGMDRVPGRTGRIEGGSNNNPRPEVQQIAEEFAESDDFNVNHTTYRDRYASSMLTRTDRISELSKAVDLVFPNVIRYISAGMAHPQHPATRE